tara:strand:- start:792 stop:1334 length:543 start_codon:yes stop_codon:yes gene_type:complete
MEIENYKQETGMATIQIRKYHGIATHDGECFRCQLWINGKLAAHVTNGGTGGGTVMDWVDASGEFVREIYSRAYADDGIELDDRGRAPFGAQDFVNPIYDDDFARANRAAWIAHKREAARLEDMNSDDDVALDGWIAVAKSRGRSTYFLTEQGLFCASCKPTAANVAAIRDDHPTALVLV